MKRMTMAACGLIGLLVLPGAAVAEIAQPTRYDMADRVGFCEAPTDLGHSCADLVVQAPSMAQVGDVDATRPYGMYDLDVSALIAPPTGGQIWVVDAGSQFGMDKRIIKKGLVFEAVSFQMAQPTGWQNW